VATLDTKQLKAALKKYDVSEDELVGIIDHIKHPELKANPVVEHRWSDTHARIGVMSDVHIGSKYVDYGALDDLFKRFRTGGVDAVYVAGDLTEGYNHRKGHSFECDLHGADAQADGVIDRIPSINKPIYFILGDHDHWHYENAGTDIGSRVDRARDDMHNLGFFDAKVDLAPGCTMELMHPSKGTAYALSYHPQKMIEALSGGEKPNILLIGHYHKIEQLFYRNIHAFQTGCIQSQTPWMKRMNLSAHKGGWILDIWFGDKGIDQLESKLLPYY